MRKKQANFEEEIKNSEEFLKKLETIKKTSQDIKDKNKLAVHRNIWIKQYKYLSRLERDSQMEINNFLENFDKFFEFQYEEKQIFGKDNFKSYSQLNKVMNDQFSNYQNNTFKQIESLPLLIDKSSKAKKSEVSVKEIKEIIQDIGLFLEERQITNQRAFQEFTKNEIERVGQEEINDDDYEDIVSLFKLFADEVKGFDFKKDQLKKIQEGEKNLKEYLQTLNQKLSEDEISEVINEFNLASQLLQQTLELQIEKISLDYEDALNFDHEVMKNSFNYQKIVHIHQVYMGRGKSVQLYFQRLSLQFPKIQKKTLQNITSCIEAKIYKEKKIKAAKRNYLREKEELFYKVQKQVNLRIEKKIKAAQRQAENLMRREEKLKLEKELQILKKDYDERQEKKRQAERVVEQAKRDEEKKKEALRKLYLDDLNKRAEQITQIKEEKEKIQQKQQKQKKEQIQEERKRKISQNKPKVNERNQIERRKLQSKLDQKEQREREKHDNEARIVNAVEHYPFRPQVQASEERLNQPTEALIKKQNTLYDKADKIELTKMTGYNVNQLMGDMRFRLNAALHQAGLANTQYARQIINGMSKRPNQQ